MIDFPSNEPLRPIGAERSSMCVRGVLYQVVVNMLLAILQAYRAASVSFSVPYEARPTHPSGAAAWARHGPIYDGSFFRASRDSHLLRRYDVSRLDVRLPAAHE